MEGFQKWGDPQGPNPSICLILFGGTFRETIQILDDIGVIIAPLALKTGGSKRPSQGHNADGPSQTN